MQSSALLLTFTQISGGTFDKAQMAILDMATAMATASGMEVDLKDTTIKVGKALNDPIQGMTALKKAGVMFTESQKEQDRKSTRLNSSHRSLSRMPSSA